MSRYVVSLEDVDRTHGAIVGGKGANLGELTRIDGIHVPPGFCVTTDAFAQVVTEAMLDLPDNEAIRAAIEHAPVPAKITSAIASAVRALGETTPCAVRSSATAEDLPNASFAGQQDTYLNVVGAEAITHHVRKCWASLFTDRAVAYRERNGISHHEVRMAVVIQEMVPAAVAGVLFTADPVTSNRKTSSIEAVRGLGEELVSGRVTPDIIKVRNGEIVERRTESTAVLTEAQALELERIGRSIEAHFGAPQDVEWCFANGRLSVVQARPITTVYPLPPIDDDENHVYLSVGHQQMMTDAMRPLGLSFWQMTTPRPMKEAGGRLFVDATEAFSAPTSRASLLALLGKSDPLFFDAVQTILDRGFVPLRADAPSSPHRADGLPPVAADRSRVADFIARTSASIAAADREIETKSGLALFDFIVEDIQELRRLLTDPRSLQVVMAGIEGVWWLNETLEKWLDEKSVGDVLTQSVPDNVTSEMGLALLDVADVVRPHAEVVRFLETVADDDPFLETLGAIEGGADARAAIEGWLGAYGMRCPGEIDITRTRWSERPSMLVPLILVNVKSFAPNEHARRFNRGLAEAAKKETEILARVRSLPDGEAKAEETKRTIDRVRAFMGYREYPKYGMIRRYGIYKRELLREGARLVTAGVLQDAHDIYDVRFDELREIVRTQKADPELLRERRKAFRSYEALVPPRVLTSEGERVNGSYAKRDVPAGALVGLAVSSGVVEGRARVIHDVARARLEPGDILVTAFTDPSFSPLFVAIAGLVTEVGGTMTHGAVIAREYGLPAVVAVADATRTIRDGQRIRVNGTEGWVEILD